MSARVIHFGRDECHRVAVLRSAGYEVSESNSLTALSLDLQRDEHIDAVIVSEDDQQNAEQAAELVRKHLRLAPVIMFRRNLDALDESKFTHVYTSFVSPEAWLSDTARLICESQAIQEQSARLRQESQAVRDQSVRERERSRRERERNKDAGSLWRSRQSGE